MENWWKSGDLVEKWAEWRLDGNSENMWNLLETYGER